MAEFHRKTQGIGFLHRCLLTMTFHSLVLFYWECSHRGIDGPIALIGTETAGAPLSR
jgi:hypothetical protein